MQSVFCNRKFTSSIKVICSPQISTCGAFVVICRRAQDVKSLSRPGTQSAELEEAGALPPVSAHTVNKGAFSGVFSPCFCMFVLSVGDTPVFSGPPVSC